jgi:hypothetical protein
MRPTYKHKIRFEDYDYDCYDGDYHKTAGGIYHILCEYEPLPGIWKEVDQWSFDDIEDVIESINSFEEEDEKMLALQDEARYYEECRKQYREWRNDSGV